MPTIGFGNLTRYLAVFGESGGKTVLLSSFYGASQEPSFLAESLSRVDGSGLS